MAGAISMDCEPQTRRQPVLGAGGSRSLYLYQVANFPGLSQEPSFIACERACLSRDEDRSFGDRLFSGER